MHLALRVGVIGHDVGGAAMQPLARTAPERQPIPRAGLTDDIAHAAVFLASDEATVINGHDLVIDGA